MRARLVPPAGTSFRVPRAAPSAAPKPPVPALSWGLRLPTPAVAPATAPGTAGRPLAYLGTSFRPAALAIAILSVALAACAQERATDRQNPSRGAGPSNEEVAIDTEVMAYLSMARAAHHEANVKEADDVAGAVAALERLTRASRPHPGKVVPEIDEVLADTYARLAELYARQGDLVKAGALVDQGLLHAETPTYFRGHLLEVGGIVEEARAAGLAPAP